MLGLFSRLWSGAGTKASSFFQFLVPSGAAWSARASRQYAEEGYSKNVIAFRCVDVISKSVASIPAVPRHPITGEAIDNHPVMEIVRRPNLLQEWSTFVEQAVNFRLITGNSFIERIPKSGLSRGVLELWVWQPYPMKVVEQDKRSPIPAGWIYDGGPDNRKTWDVDKVTGDCDLMVWKSFHPFNRFFGMSPLEAAAWSVDQHNSSSEWNQRLLQNSGNPAGVFQVKGSLTESQYQRVREEIREKYLGSKNAGIPMLLEGDMQWVATGMNARDLDWINGRNISAREIAGALGVPTQVIPIQGDQTFANYEQARLALWEDTVIPLAENFFRSISRLLQPFYPTPFVLTGDYDEIPALEPRRKERWDKVQNASFLTINEKRQAVGYEEVPTPNADLIWVPSGLLPLDDAVPNGDEEVTDEDEEDEDESV